VLQGCYRDGQCCGNQAASRFLLLLQLLRETSQSDYATCPAAELWCEVALLRQQPSSLQSPILLINTMLVLENLAPIGSLWEQHQNADPTGSAGS